MPDSVAMTRLKDRFAQQGRAGLPFNPLDASEITGANVDRLKLGMEGFGWRDLRFITQEQAALNGWTIPAEAASVRITVRDLSKGTVSERLMYNAESVLGMPSLQAMMAMSEAEIRKMRGEVDRKLAAPAKTLSAASADVAEPVADLDDEIEIGPAPQPELQAMPEQRIEKDASDLFFAQPLPASEATVPEVGAEGLAPAEGGQEPARSGGLDSFAVMAPYWLDGLHNFDGLELAKRVNKLVESQKLARDKAAIATLLQTYPNARRLGLGVVSRDELLNDPHLKANVSEPPRLLGGELMRDNEGGYRPKAGGPAVLKDKGNAVSLRAKSDLGYRGAMELALLKGWKAIELKGPPKVMAKAWVEAKVMGLDVVNYKPTEQDRQNLAERIAQEARKHEAAAARAEEQAPEFVEVLPAIGQDKGLPTTVTRSAVVRSTEVDPGVPQAPNAPAYGQAAEVVTRTVVRVGDTVRADVAVAELPLAGQRAASEIAQEAAEPVVDREASMAIGEAERLRASVAALEGAQEEDLPVRLVGHGAAPYRRNKANGMSYFADVEIAPGVTKTVWGKDLQRSLVDAGAEPGDSIVLKEEGRTSIVGTDGKTSHPVKWQTTVHMKGMAVALPENAPDIEVAMSGLHIGPVVKVEGGRIAQKAGRDPNVLVWHDVSKLTGPVPDIGEDVEISYGIAGGHVKTPARKQELSR